MTDGAPHASSRLSRKRWINGYQYTDKNLEVATTIGAERDGSWEAGTRPRFRNGHIVNQSRDYIQEAVLHALPPQNGTKPRWKNGYIVKGPPVQVMPSGDKPVRWAKGTQKKRPAKKEQRSATPPAGAPEEQRGKVLHSDVPCSSQHVCAGTARLPTLTHRRLFGSPDTAACAVSCRGIPRGDARTKPTRPLRGVHEGCRGQHDCHVRCGLLGVRVVGLWVSRWCR